MNGVEAIPFGNDGSRSTVNVAAFNEHAAGVMARLGVRVLRVFKYTAWADPAEWPGMTQAGRHELTSDGTHAEGSTQSKLMARELLSELAARPPGSLAHLRAGEAACWLTRESAAKVASRAGS